MTVSRENQTSHTQQRVLRLVNHRLDARRDIKDKQPHMGIQLVKITRSCLWIFRSTGQLHPEIIIPPARVMHRLFIDTGSQITTVRTATHIAIRIAY